MKAITVYEALDGRRFDTEQRCVEHDTYCADAAAANEMLANGATLFAVLARANQSRHYWHDTLSIEEKALLMRMSQDTGVSVPHWQCRDEPGYKFCRVEPSGEIFLFGDSGSWSGSYGDVVSQRDFLRYAAETLKVKP